MESLNEIRKWLQQPYALKGNPGQIVLFTGSQKPDKLKAAETLAAETGKTLHCVDLSQVVSKYIGETEKNLQKIFEQAQTGGWVLFFDEADALFGKRTNVKDSHDRYANTEINYLLEQSDKYAGLVILATKAKPDIDPAFHRRFGAVLHFDGK